jgi:exopolysaccharide production protein ExoZ
MDLNQAHSPQREATRFNGIQFLRFIAAALVLIAHISLVVHERLDASMPVWDKGTIGVYVFFAISGFVMMKASKPDAALSLIHWRIFLKRRLIRVVPMYWLATTIKLLVVLAAPNLALHSNFEVKHTLASYFFINHLNAEGNISPLHAVGWTLNYEMLFYLVFATLIATKIRALMGLTLFFGALVGLGEAFDLSQYVSLNSYLQPILLQFVLGCWLHPLSKQACKLASSTQALLGSIVLAASLAWLSILADDIVDIRGWPGFLCAGLGSTMLVMAVILLEPTVGRHTPALMVKLGESSYALYLFHPFALGSLMQLILMSQLPCTKLQACLVLFVGGVSVCHMLYKLVEQPVSTYLTARFG